MDSENLETHYIKNNTLDFHFYHFPPKSFLWQLKSLDIRQQKVQRNSDQWKQADDCQDLET